MEEAKMARIGELSRKQRSVGLTPEEQAEQAALRREYIDSMRSNLRATLENTVIVQPDGTCRPVKRKQEQ